jgi:Concanavalin A-like lectin/glucanases superfamily
MSEQYPGGFINQTAPTLNPALGNAAPGIWNMTQVQQAVKSSTWPGYDPYYKYVTLNLHGNGTNGAQNNTFLDSSTNNFTVTRNGNTTQGTFSPYGSNWSNYFDGSSYLSSTAASISGADFTIEAWVYLTATSNSGHLFSFGTNEPNRFSIYRDNANNKWSLAVVNGGAYTITAATNTAIANTWNHVAFVRSGTTNYLYVNGVREASNTASLNSGTARYIAGNFGISTDNIYGYVSNFRVSTSALYTGTTYTVPTAPFIAGAGTNMLTCQSNRFIDNSSNAYAITTSGSPSVQRFSPFSPTSAYSTSVIGGSGYFDGSGDYLSAPNSTAFDFSTSDFTITCWVYPTTSGTTRKIATYSNGTALNSNYAFTYEIDTNNKAKFLTINGSTVYSTVSTPSVITNAWNYLVVTRSGATINIYVNGTGTSGTQSATINNPVLSTLTIGAERDATVLLTGYMTDLALLKGVATAPSSSNPTSPTTSNGNTSLLLNYTNAGILDNAMMNDLETVGNAQISTSVYKYGTGSMYFDGTGDQLYSIANQNTAFGTGDFTIEFWVYGLSGAARQDWFDLYNGTTANRIQIIWVSSQFGYYQNNTFVTGGGTYATSTWYHVALTRASGSNRLFVNGTQVGTTATNTTNFSGNALYLGKSSSGGTDFNGYIDDLRITNGVARYTTNFTPPTSQLQDQ